MCPQSATFVLTFLILQSERKLKSCFTDKILGFIFRSDSSSQVVDSNIVFNIYLSYLMYFFSQLCATSVREVNGAYLSNLNLCSECILHRAIFTSADVLVM